MEMLRVNKQIFLIPLLINQKSLQFQVHQSLQAFLLPNSLIFCQKFLKLRHDILFFFLILQQNSHALPNQYRQSEQIGLQLMINESMQQQGLIQTLQQKQLFQSRIQTLEQQNYQFQVLVIVVHLTLKFQFHLQLLRPQRLEYKMQTLTYCILDIKLYWELLKFQIFLKQTKSTTSTYTSQNFNLETNSYFIVAYSKIQFSNTSLYRLKFLITTTGTTAQYTLQTWSSSVYPPNTVSTFQMKYILSYEFKPIECETVRISKYLDRKINEKISKQMNLVEANKIYITEGTDQILVADTIQTLNIIVYFKCYPNKKVHAEINKCNCLKQLITLDRNCHGSMNIIYFYMLFTSQQDFKELAITTTTKGFSIDQTIRNYEIQTKNVLNIQMEDI
ncbi:unnamed protein product [Paramecium sonneborni]|uniref:Uncharacterized protein n=1 Tax=Paramecium sonneborni TaxID=65129 RepID=A0A8S1NVR6_9CILI|nr:unnamed protein product [Paramecium sonneborni]